MLPFTEETLLYYTEDVDGGSWMAGLCSLTELEEFFPSAASAFGVTFPDHSWPIAHQEVRYLEEHSLADGMLGLSAHDVESPLFDQPAVEYPDLSVTLAIDPFVWAQDALSPLTSSTDLPLTFSSPLSSTVNLNNGQLDAPPSSSFASDQDVAGWFGPIPTSSPSLTNSSVRTDDGSLSLSFVQDITPFASPSSASSPPLSDMSESDSSSTSSSPGTQSNSELSDIGSEVIIDIEYQYKIMRDDNGRRSGYECLLCSTQVGAHGAMKRHLESLAHQAPSYDCRACGRLFTRDDARKRHEKNKHNIIFTEEDEDKDKSATRSRNPRSSN